MHTQGTRREIGPAAAVSDAAGALRRRTARRRRACRERAALLAVRTEQGAVPLADQHAGRGGFLLLRQPAARRHALLPRPHPPRLPAGLASARCARVEHGPEKWVPVFPRNKREAFARTPCSKRNVSRSASRPRRQSSGRTPPHRRAPASAARARRVYAHRRRPGSATSRP